MTIDSLAILGRSRFGLELTEQAILDNCRELDVSLTLVSPPHPPDHDLVRANEAVAAAVDRSAGRLLGLCRVDPWDNGGALEALERAAARPGIRGVLLNPFEENFRINDARVKPVARKAAELKLPVVVVSGIPWQSEATQVAQFADWSADNPVIMTNGGQYNISGLAQSDAEAALALANVYLQTNGVYREDFLQRVVEEFGSERLLFASSAPYFDPRFEKRRVELLHVEERDRDAILERNASTLFSITSGKGAAA